MENGIALIRLRERADMCARLYAIDKREHLKGFLYPGLMKLAGLALQADDVVRRLTIAVDDFIVDMAPALQASFVQQEMPRYIEAMIEDASHMEQIKRRFAERMTKRLAELTAVG